jgi:two-component system response regulator HupR/HoxA
MIVCVVDDVPENARYVERILTDYTTHRFTDPHAALRFMRNTGADVLVADQKMPGLSGLELVHAVREHSTDFIAIIISAYTDSEDLIDAVNSNLVYKYVVKPFSPHILLQHVHRAVERLQLSRSNDQLQEQLRTQNRQLAQENQVLKGGSQSVFDVFLGSAPEIQRLEELTQLYAMSREPVLITGETGTGKELLARSVHAFSPRNEHPFLPLNCSALHDSLIESELFGYVRGAFTGANRQKTGLLEAADGGTVFLDEIGDLPVSLQPKLLRVLQFGTFIPVGGTEERSVDVRIVSATNKDLEAQVARGLFREDLLYRINAFHLRLPPLRERRGDIYLILKRIAAIRGISVPSFTADALDVLRNAEFPGNVRELQSVLERLVVLQRHSERAELDAETVREALHPNGNGSTPVTANHAACVSANGDPIAALLPQPGEPVDLAETLESLRYRLILTVFEQEAGNISRSAVRLGLSRQGLKKKLRSYGLIGETVPGANHGRHGTS